MAGKVRALMQWYAAIWMTAWLAAAPIARCGDVDADAKRSVARGLAYLAESQAADGRWEADGGSYRVAMTSLCTMAFLMDGNTPVQGRYADRVDRGVRFVLSMAQPNGLIGRGDSDGRYMYGHGFAMLMLSQVVGEDADSRRRVEIARVLEKAVLFCGQAQTTEGGWGYLTAAEGFGFDEGSVTITQVQGLRGCKNAGIPVPREIITKGVKYIEKCTTSTGVKYSLKTEGGVRPPLSAAAVATLFNSGEHDHPLAAKLQKVADDHFALGKDEDGVAGHWHYAHYYYAQSSYRRGGAKWRKYRDIVFRRVIDQQDPSGAWTQGWMGPIYTTSLNLGILQQDSAALPIYQR